RREQRQRWPRSWLSSLSGAERRGVQQQEVSVQDRTPGDIGSPGKIAGWGGWAPTFGIPRYATGSGLACAASSVARERRIVLGRKRNGEPPPEQPTATEGSTIPPGEHRVNGEKTQPVHRIRIRHVTGAIWQNERQNGSTYYNFTLSRSYRDEQNN